MQMDRNIPNRWTIADREENRYHDSYFHATIFDATTGEVWTGMIGATAFGGGHYASPYPNIDTAPAEVQDAYRAIRREQVEAAARRDVTNAAAYIAAGDIFLGEENEFAAKVGTVVEVFKGRKVPKGTTGTVAWVGPDKFNPGAVRYGLDVDGERVWIAGGNVRLIDPEKFTIDEAAIERHIEKWVARAAEQNCRVNVRVPTPNKDEMIAKGILIPA